MQNTTQTITLETVSRELAELNARAQELKRQERSLKACQLNQKRENDLLASERRREIARRVNYGPTNWSVIPTDLRYKVSKYMTIGDFHEYTCGCIVANYTLPDKYQTRRRTGAHQVRRECLQHNGTTEPKHNVALTRHLNQNQCVLPNEQCISGVESAISGVESSIPETDSVTQTQCTQTRCTQTQCTQTHLQRIQESKKRCRQIETQIHLARMELNKEYRIHNDLILQTKVESDPLATKVVVSQFPWANKALYEQFCKQEGL
jgi:hypothetical protein